jgi:hypothetical protein
MDVLPRVVVLRLLMRVTEMAATQTSPDSLLQQIRATNAIQVTLNLFEMSKSNGQEQERIWSYALVCR